MWVSLVLCILPLVYVPGADGQRTYSQWAKKRLIESFRSKCLSYEWVRNYIRERKQRLSRPDEEKKYAIFIYDDGFKRAKKGGLGDRLGGLVTAFTWAMRTNRTFLIEADNSGLGKFLGPYPGGAGGGGGNGGSTRSWVDWKWSGYDERKIQAKEKTYLWCYNPKPRSNCGLDNAHQLDEYTVVQLRINR